MTLMKQVRLVIMVSKAFKIYLWLKIMKDYGV